MLNKTKLKRERKQAISEQKSGQSVPQYHSQDVPRRHQEGPPWNPTGSQCAPHNTSATSPHNPPVIDLYFNREEFQMFPYSPNHPLMSEFRKLSAMKKWDDDSEVRQMRYNEFMEILVSQFNQYYGIDAEDIEPWQNLCQAIGIFPVPNSLEKAREVRIWDLEI